jgi:hypothetical protein
LALLDLGGMRRVKIATRFTALWNRPRNRERAIFPSLVSTSGSSSVTKTVRIFPRGHLLRQRQLLTDGVDLNGS